MQHELNSLDELASSRPIALSELWNRASLRGKATRSLQPAHHASTRIEDAKETANDAIPAAITPCKPFSYFSSTSQSENHEDSRNRRWGSSLEHLQNQEELCIATQASEVEGLGWYTHSDTHIHENPLSYSTAFNLSHPQYPGHNRHEDSEFSSFNSRVFFRMGHASWPTNAHSAYNSHGDSYSQDLSSGNPHMTGAYIERPHASMEAESNQLSYKPFSTQEYHYYNGDFHSTLSQQGHQAQESDIAEIKLASRQEWVKPVPKSTQGRISGSMELQRSAPIQVSNVFHNRKLSSAESISSKESSKNSTKEEASSYLHSVVENAQLNTQCISQSSMTEPSTSVVKDCSGADDGGDLRKPISYVLRTKQKEMGDTRTGSEHSFPPNEPFTLFYDTGQLSIKRSGNYGYESNIAGDVIQETYGGGATTASKVTRPPPGLFMPSKQGQFSGSLYLDNPFVPKSVKIETANTWFHMDNRGQEQLRQYVTAIAQDHSERTALFNNSLTSAPKATTAMQITLLLGNIIANLQAYVSRNQMEQTEYFSTYGEAQQHCYEATHDRNHSFFDRDPMLNQWGLPSNQDSHCLSKKQVRKRASTIHQGIPDTNQPCTNW